MDLRFWRRKQYSLNDVLFALQGRSVIQTNEEAFEKVEYVYDCVKTRAQKIASIPWHIWSKVGNKEVENTKLESKFSNKFMTSTQFLESIVSWLDLRGLAFVRDLGLEFEILDSDLTVLRWKNGTPSGRWEDIEVVYYRNGMEERYNLDQVKIIRNFSPYSRLVGVSTMSAVFGTVEIQENQDRAVANLMKNGAYVPIVLTSDQKLTLDQIKQAQEVWRQRYSGIDNAGLNVPVFGSGLQPQKIGLSPADMNILDREQLTKDRIYSAFGVPKKDFQQLNRATAEVQQEFFIRTTIMPLADSIAEQITRFILDNKGEFRFDYKALPEMQGDLLTQAQIEEIYTRSGIRTINEVRADKGLPPVPWGNDYWAPLSQTSFGTYEQQQNALNNLAEQIANLKSLIIEDKKKDYEEIKWKLFIARTTPQEQKLAKEIQKYFKKQGEYVISELEKRAKGLGPEDLVPSFLPPDAKADLMKLLKNYLISFMQQAGDAIIEEYDLGISFNVMIPQIQNWLKDRLEKTALEMTQTTEKDLYDTLLDGISQGEGIPDLSKRVQTLFEETYKHRSRTIARTEVIGANNKASLVCAMEGGMRYKTWLTALDERTRPWHADANGQTVGIEDKFLVMGEELEEPGDTSASPENIINCRCTMTFSRGE